MKTKPQFVTIDTSLFSIGQAVVFGDDNKFIPSDGSTLLTLAGDWESGVVYGVDYIVTHNGSSYASKLAHTSSDGTGSGTSSGSGTGTGSSFDDEPGVGADWETYWQLLAGKGADGTDGADGTNGTNGTNGTDGADGADGEGVPAGGTTGQILAKIDNTDYNTEWIDPPEGGSGSGTGTGGTVSNTISVSDGTTTTSDVDTIEFDGATVEDNGDGSVTVAVTGGGLTTTSATNSSWANGESLVVTHGADAGYNRIPRLLAKRPIDAELAELAALLHFDGTDASTTFTDTQGNTFTPTGDVSISTAQKEFGTASGKFNQSANSGYLTCDSSLLDFGSSDFTNLALGLFTSVGSGYQFLVNNRTADSSGFQLILETSGNLHVYGTVSGTGWDINLSGDIPSENTWTHIAFVRYGDVFTIYQDGTATASSTVSGSIISASDAQIGWGGSNNDSYFNGYMDELVITRNALWTDDFTPPTSAYNPTLAYTPQPLNNGSSIRTFYGDTDGSSDTTKTTFINNTGTTLDAKAIVSV